MNVYILKLGSTMYKVGKADVVSKRVSQIQSQIPMEIELIATLSTKDAFGVENSIHRELAKSRIHGEWFELAEEEIGYIIEKYGFITEVSFKAKFGRKEIEKIGLSVFYSNILAESKYDMTSLEKDIIYLLVEKISSGDSSDKYYRVGCSDITKITGHRVRIDDFSKAAIRLSSRVSTYNNRDYEFISECIPQGNDCLVKIGKDIFTHILLLKNTLTSDKIKIAMQLKSKYPKRIYEILLSNFKNKKTGSGIKNKNEFTIDVDFFRESIVFDTEKYNTFSELKRKVIDYSLSEINKYTNTNTSCEYIKNGRKIVSIRFFYNSNAK